MKKIGVFLMALALLLSGCSSGGYTPENNQLGAFVENQKEEAEVLPPRKNMAMIYYEDMDQNPLTTTNRENHELLKLVYSPLIRLDASLKPVYVLAGGITVEGTRCTVVLREGLKFSDGSAVTAADVSASIRTVRKNPTSPYYNRLSNVRSWEVADHRTIVLSLREPDADFINELDLPVVKNGGSVGCGPYRFGEQNGKTVLVPNEHYFEQPSIQTIELKAPANVEERQNLFSVGLLDVYFESEESDLEFSGGRDYRVQTYAGDDLLFLGINCQKDYLNQAGIRRFLNQLLEREKIAREVLLEQAEATAYPFRAGWYKAEGLTHQQDWTAAQKKEAAHGVGFSLTETALLDANGTQLTFSLLVSESALVQMNVAQAVAESFALSGVKILVEPVSRADYEKRLAAGDFDLYLGEMKTGRSLNTALYAAGSAVNYSFGNFEALEAVASAYGAGETDLKAVAAAFDAATPLIPIAYRQGLLFTAADVGDFSGQGSWAIYGDITKLKLLERRKNA